MSISHYQDSEVQRLATEIRQELELDRARLRSLEALGSWVRRSLYPVVRALAILAAIAAPPEPPT